MRKTLLVSVVVLSAFGCAPPDVTPPPGGSGGSTTPSSGGATGSGGSNASSGGSVGSTGGTVGSSGGAFASGGSTGNSGGTIGSTGGSGSGTGGRGTGGAATGTGGAAPGDAAAVGALFQGQAWLLRCGQLNAGTLRVCSNTNTIASNNLSHDNPLAGGVNRNDFTNAAGTAGQPYCVTIRVQGISEAKQYVNDTVTNRSGTPYGVTGTLSFGNTTEASLADGSNGWAVGGMPTANGDYNVYAILVDSPRQIYYLNSINTNGVNRQNHSAYAFDYTASFTINGGSRVQFMAADFNRNAIVNCADPIVESVCNQLPNITPLPSLQGPTGMAVTVTQPVMGQLVITSLVASRAGACTCSNAATCQ
jgi:hypothetical protein